MKSDINSAEFWVKIVGFLQQNWAIVEYDKEINQFTIMFIDDGSIIFDKIIFNSKEDAENGLLRNGFKKYLDEKENFIEFISPPKQPHIESLRNTYSSGKYWK